MSACFSIRSAARRSRWDGGTLAFLYRNRRSDMFVKKFSTTAVLPVRATAGSGGYDLAADLPAPVVIEPGQSLLIPTGVGFALPEGAVGLVMVVRMS